MFYNIKGEQIFYMQDRFSESLNILSAGKTLPNPKWEALHISNEINSAYTFEYILDGEMIIETDKQRLTARKGDFLFMNKTATHYSYSSPDKPFKKYFLVVNGSFIDEIVKLYNLNSRTIIERLNVSEEFKEIFDNIGKMEKAQIYDTVTLNILRICQKYYHLKNAGSDISDSSSGSSVIYSIAAYINENINKNITVNYLSEIFHFSPAHIIRIFKTNFNMTPKQYILETKIDVAKKLLSYSAISIEDISRRLDFSNSANFSLAFKKSVGMSPKEYRNKNPYKINSPKQG